MPSSRHRRTSAFTLIEVCLVVAIVILLVIVLIPAFHKRKPVQLAPEEAPSPTPSATVAPLENPAPATPK
jgi:hypothetical protein